MDCQMPQMDGYDATRAIRGLEGEASKTPIIAMTAAAMKEDEDKALAAGMDAYVAKPVRQDVLATVLQRWIRQSDAPDAPAEAETEPEDGVLDDATIGRLRELDDDVGGMAELAELFITDARKNIETLRRAAASGDAETARGAAHSLKGSAGNFGAHELSQMCGIVEQGAAKGELSAVSGQLEGIQAEFDRVTEALRAAFASHAPSKA
jgi:two-component system sensor histidine kinase/response regulator